MHRLIDGRAIGIEAVCFWGHDHSTSHTVPSYVSEHTGAQRLCRLGFSVSNEIRLPVSSLSRPLHWFYCPSASTVARFE